MMERIRELIWYATVLVLFVVLYNVASRYRMAVVDQNFKLMVPVIEPGDFHAIDCGDRARNQPMPDDIIAFRSPNRRDPAQMDRMFGRVAAVPGSTVTVREGRLLVDGTEVADAPPELEVLATGMVVPRRMVLVVFDADQGGGRRRVFTPLTKRLVPFRDIIGRVMGR
jgi:hypothetical protein